MESDAGGGGLWPDPQQRKEQRLPLFLALTTQETLCFTTGTKHTPQDANVGVHRATRAPGGGRKPREVLCLGDVQWATDSGDRRRRGAGEGCIVPSDESTVGYLGALCWPTEGLHVPVHDQLLRTRPKY